MQDPVSPRADRFLSNQCPVRIFSGRYRFREMFSRERRSISRGDRSMFFRRDRRRVASYLMLAGVLFLAERAGVVQAAGADVWNLPGLERQLQDDAARRLVLERRDEETMHRMAVKENLIADLRAGVRSLADVADEFYRMNADAPESIDLLCAHFQCTDEREACARSVVAYMVPNSDLSNAPDCVKAEFAQLFGHPL
jgi:hypothetical protein